MTGAWPEPNSNTTLLILTSFHRQTSQLWPMVPRQSATSWQAKDNIQWRNGEQHLADGATISPSPRAGVETKKTRAPIVQTIPARGAYLPGPVRGEGPPKKQNVNLPPLRTIFPDLLETQPFSQQPFHSAQQA